MTDWKELYQQKLIPVEDIAKVIPAAQPLFTLRWRSRSACDHA